MHPAPIGARPFVPSRKFPQSDRAPAADVAGHATGRVRENTLSRSHRTQCCGGRQRMPRAWIGWRHLRCARGRRARGKVGGSSSPGSGRGDLTTCTGIDRASAKPSSACFPVEWGLPTKGRRVRPSQQCLAREAPPRRGRASATCSTSQGAVRRGSREAPPGGRSCEVVVVVGGYSVGLRGGCRATAATSSYDASFARVRPVRVAGVSRRGWRVNVSVEETTARRLTQVAGRESRPSMRRRRGRSTRAPARAG